MKITIYQDPENVVERNFMFSGCTERSALYSVSQAESKRSDKKSDQFSQIGFSVVRFAYCFFLSRKYLLARYRSSTDL